MTREEFAGVAVGDIIRHRSSAHGMTVIERVGDTLIVQRISTATHAVEWDHILKRELSRPVGVL